MFRTLYGKLALALLALLSLVGGLFVIADLFSTRLFLQEINQGLNRDLASHLVKESLPLEGGEVQPSALEHIFHMLMVINPSIEVYLLDPEGNLLAFSAPEGSVVRDRVSLNPIHSFLEGTDRLPILGDDPRDLCGEKVFSAAPIGSASSPEGYLYVILGGEQYDSAVAMIRGSYMQRLGLGASLAALVFAFASGLLLFALMTRRVRRLAAAMDAFKESDFAEPVSLGGRRAPGGDEIDRLGDTFIQMSDRITAQLDELKKTDELRRELIANVSHDLRTPITSLQGYLETLHVKAESLSEAEKSEYLAIALSRLHAELPTSSHRVRADVGLIARVLENLLGNALRYTPAGGQVTVRLVADDSRLQVRVEDTGPGIAPEHLPRIFERFFHRTPEGRRSHDGSGLGLAIAQKALSLHGSSLEVDSELGRGSTFFFDLVMDRA
jgi:signal transduction histidine kinase